MTPFDRNIHNKIERLLRIFLVVALVGERQVGKTVLSKMLRPVWRYVEENKLPFGLLINQSKEPMWLSDTVYQLPVGWILFSHSLEHVLESSRGIDHRTQRT